MKGTVSGATTGATIGSVAGPVGTFVGAYFSFVLYLSQLGGSLKLISHEAQSNPSRSPLQIL